MLLLGLSLVEETPITPILAALHCVHLYANETALIHMHLHNMLFALVNLKACSISLTSLSR